MKKLLMVLPLFYCCMSFAQQKIDTPAKVPVVFVDSMLVDENYYKGFLPEEILKIDVKRGAEFPNGAVYITTKDKQKTQELLKSPLLSLGDIVKKNVSKSQRSKPIIFLLDGAMLTDTANVRIPALAVRSVTIKEAADIPYFKTALPNILLLAISTKPPVILLRGDVTAKE